VSVVPVIPALGRLKQQDGNFEASLGYVALRPCLKTNEQQKMYSTILLLHCKSRIYKSICEYIYVL
jgi:hypothetical protein